MSIFKGKTKVGRFFKKGITAMRHNRGVRKQNRSDRRDARGVRRSERRELIKSTVGTVYQDSLKLGNRAFDSVDSLGVGLTGSLSNLTGNKTLPLAILGASALGIVILMKK